MCRLGPITLSKDIGFPIFSQISLTLVDVHSFLLTFFPVFVICTTSLGSFFSSGFFIDPQFSPCIMCVQYCSVHRGMFSRLEGYHEYIGGISSVHRGMFSRLEGYHEYIGGISSVHRGDIMMDVGGHHDYIGGYHEYTGGISSVHRGWSVHRGIS